MKVHGSRRAQGEIARCNSAQLTVFTKRSMVPRLGVELSEED